MMVKLFNSKPMHFVYIPNGNKKVYNKRSICIFSSYKYTPPKHDETISSTLDDSALFFIAYALRKRNY